MKCSNETTRKLSPLLVKKPHLNTNDPQTIKSTLSPHGSTYSKMTDTFSMPECISTNKYSTGTKRLVVENSNTSPTKSVSVPVGAGLRFGRAGISRKAKVIRTERNAVHSSETFRFVSNSRVYRNSRSNMTKRGHCIIDSGADTMCIGDGFKILARTGRVVTLRGFDDGETLVKEVEVVSGATAWDDDDGTTYILVINEALDLGPTQKTTLLCPNQIRSYGHQIDGIPKFLTRGNSVHGILTMDDIYMPFDLSGKTSVLHTCLPTENELNVCEYVQLTSDEPWDPDADDWAQQEAKYTRGARNNVRGGRNTTSSTHVNSTLEPYTSQVRTIGKTSSGSHRLDTPIADIQRRFGGCTLEVANHTIDSTTQLAERCGEMPLHRRYKTKVKQLQYRRLCNTLYSDTFSASIRSTRGNTKTQGFVNGDSLYVYHFPMSTESKAPLGLVSYIHEVGIPSKIHTDNAKIETLGDWKKTTQEYHIKTSTTEPYSPWQNKAEREFGKVRSLARRLLDGEKVHPRLWDYAQELACEIHNHTARKVLKWRTPLEIETGDTPDCSHLLYFDFYQPVWYWDNPDISYPAPQK